MATYTTLISKEELAQQLDSPQLRIIDCRFTLFDIEKGRNDFHQAHIPKATYVHMDEDLSGEIKPGITGRHPLPPVETTIERFSAWGIGNGVQVVVYDYGNGAIASRLWWMLRWMGHEAVAVLDGGWAGWSAAGLPQTAERFSAMRREFEATPRPELLADAAEVDRRRMSAEHLVVDARASLRYQGIEEPIDPVAGHIPGAVNAPYAENLDENGHLRSREALRARFEEVLGAKPVERTIVYCGSGVTACHNLLAIKHAGLGEAKLYAGSWSDWITNPEREVEKK